MSEMEPQRDETKLDSQSHLIIKEKKYKQIDNENFYETDCHQWTSYLKNYRKERKNLEWGYNTKPERISHKDVKQKDVTYHPILQVYSDKAKEKKLQAIDKQSMIETLAKNKDNSLRIEQTYDIINLKDKLVGLDTQKINFNKKKKEKISSSVNYKNNKNFSQKEYNIISNITVDKHNFLKPELRPKISDTHTERPIYTVSNNYRDYDIISNKYKEQDKEKKKVDLEIMRYTSAKLFNTRNTYNPIKGQYYDEEKERKYLKEQDEKAKNWGKINKRIIGEGDLYNPINMSIVDDQQLIKADNKARNKKKRYELRFQIEDFYRNKSLKDLDKKLTINKSNVKNESHSDIFRGNNYESNWHNHQERIVSTAWEKLEKNANSKNTLKNGTIYKDPYDFSEASKKEEIFRKQRQEMLIDLPPMKNDKIYEMKNHSNPLHLKTCNSFVHEMKNFSTSKKDFFSNNKNVIQS